MNTKAWSIYSSQKAEDRKSEFHRAHDLEILSNMVGCILVGFIQE